MSIKPAHSEINQYYEFSANVLIETAERAILKDTNVLPVKKREMAQAAIRREMTNLRSKVEKWRASGMQDGDIFSKVNPLIDELLKTNAKRVSNFQKAEQSQSVESQKAVEVFNQIADLMLP